MNDAERVRIATGVLEAALDAIIAIDGRGSVVAWNPAAVDMFQWEQHEALGRPLGELIIPPHLRAAHYEGLRRFLAEGDGPAVNRRLTLPGVRRDRTELQVELTISVAKSDGDPLFVGWLRDVTELVEARRAAEHSERRLASMLANISDIVTVLDSEGRWLSSTGAGVRQLGYDAGLGSDGVLALVHREDRHRIDQAVSGCSGRAERRPLPFDIRVRAADGEWHVLETVVENLLDEPAVEGFVLTSRDVTRQRARALEAERITSRLGALARSLHDGVLFVDSGQTIVFVNQAFCDLFRLDEAPDDLVGEPTNSIRPAADALVADTVRFGRGIAARVEEGKQQLAEEVLLADGRILERDYTPVLAAGEAPGHLWLYRDISQRRALESAQARIVDVERNLREQAEKQATTLQSVAELKSEIVARVSHDLRTPLTSIVSLADQLLIDLDDEAVADLDHNELRQFATVISRNADRLGRLVDDLLLLGNLEAGVAPVELTEHALSEIVERAVFNVARSTAGQRRNIRTHVAPGPPCLVDANRIEQVIENLLSNAIKYTEDRGSIDVTALHDGTSWSVHVTDDGIGVPAEEQSLVFDSFFRASTARSIPGTGLGLAISRSIVELHGGTITVSSSVGEGATFTFTIPDRLAT